MTMRVAGAAYIRPAQERVSWGVCQGCGRDVKPIQLVYGRQFAARLNLCLECACNIAVMLGLLIDGELHR